jgi:histidyl-tRNA synthetase
VGFGLGDVGMANFLEVHELTPDLTSKTDVYLIVIGDVMRQAQGVARLLRQEGVNVAVDIIERNIDKQIKTAVKKQVSHALFVGEQELADELFSLKDLRTGQEEKLSIERVISLLKDERTR